MTFYKYQGTGNDFVILDNRDKTIRLEKEKIKNLCDRRFGIGADGLMLLENEKGYDFKMVYYNADGGESTMCGNGGRCLVQFANDIGIKKMDYTFLAIDGPHEAMLQENNWVALKMIDVNTIEKIENDTVLNTGSPHYVLPQKGLADFDVYSIGKTIRNSVPYNQLGINVNFVEKISEQSIFVRTYERGVEDETYSCGTGVTAAAIANAYQIGENTIDIKTLGGNLQVSFTKVSEQQYNNIWLKGPATFVFKGEIN